MVVHRQFFLVRSPSCTSPSGKYEVIRCPSAYCATSSGMAMTSIRVSTQPALPSLVRTRLQSSIGIGAGGSDLDSGFSGSSISSLGTESSSQFSGGLGAGGVGGGGTLCCDFSLRLREARTGFGGATGEET